MNLKEYDESFWRAIDELVKNGRIVIDRVKGSAHPTYPDLVYELDYGYIENTSSMDGDGIDIWRGSLPTDTVSAIVCIVDLVKRDSEIKLLVGCTEKEVEKVYCFHNRTDGMKGILIKR